MKRNPVKVVGVILLALTTTLLFVSACGVSAGNPSPVPTIPQATAKPQATSTPVPVATTGAMPPVATSAPPQPVGVSSDDCEGLAADTSSVPPIPQATAKPQATSAPAPVAPTGTIPLVGTTPTPQPADVSSDALLTQGKLIFDTSAGEVGCAYCHGLDGKGKGTSGMGAPDIRGTSEAKVRSAITGGAPAMSFIKLSDKEITAVVAYLLQLNK